MNLSAVSAISGLQTNTVRVGVAAHDIANVNTPAYEQSDLVQSEAQPGTQVAAILRTPSQSESSNTDLAKEMGQELTLGEKGYTANLKVLQTQDEMLGNLLDLKG